MSKPILPLSETQVRFARFLIVGGGSALVQINMLAALVSWMPDRAAFVLSWVASTTVHYLCNRFWALPSDRRDTPQQLGEYLLTAGLSLVINWAAFEVFYSWAGMNALWSTVLAIPPSTVVVFLLLNYRVFRKRRAGTPPAAVTTAGPDPRA
jgi:putative flippase GtrA